MRILATNDDGIDSPGLFALAGAFRRAGHEVVVVAPTGERSGSSAAIGPLHRGLPIPVDEHHWPGLPDVVVLAIDAPPATAVYGACLGGFGPVPDAVVCGVNPGANTGHLVLHSGTVGAALTAAGLGVPGLAASIAWSDDGAYAWDTGARFAVAAVDWLVAPSSPPRVLNVNVPNRPFAEVLGVREARLAPYGTVWAASADHAGGELLLDFAGNDVEPAADTDLALVRAGYAALTPLPVLEPAAFDGVAAAVDAAISGSGRSSGGRRAP